VSQDVAVEMPGRILVVEDDPTVAEVVVRYLQREGFTVEAVDNGHTALERAEAVSPDLVVLDIMLPGIDGIEVCRRLRERAPIPIVMLTALGDESDRVLGLELGADDYIGKPFSPRELTARVKAVLRRARAPLSMDSSSDHLVVRDLEVDAAGRQVRVHGRPVALTVREFDLLLFLMMHSGRAFSRAELLEKVWGYSFGDTSTVTVHVRRLREKIENDSTNPRLIVTVWGVGYRFDS
jgi:two-component system, OmpR family, response regulator ResD